MNDLFIFATRHKLRFSSVRGELPVEQLWDAPLRSRDDFNLNVIAKVANRALKELTEESFVETAKTAELARREAAMEIVKHVIDVKLTEEEAAKRRATSKQERAALLQALAEKQAGALSALSVEDLQKRIAALED